MSLESYLVHPRALQPTIRLFPATMSNEGLFSHDINRYDGISRGWNMLLTICSIQSSICRLYIYAVSILVWWNSYLFEFNKVTVYSVYSVYVFLNKFGSALTRGAAQPWRTGRTRVVLIVASPRHEMWVVAHRVVQIRLKEKLATSFPSKTMHLYETEIIVNEEMKKCINVTGHSHIYCVYYIIQKYIICMLQIYVAFLCSQKIVCSCLRPFRRVQKFFRSWSSPGGHVSFATHISQTPRHLASDLSKLSRPNTSKI